MKRGPHQILIAIDAFVNALFAGSARQTISARAGYGVYRGKFWAKVLAPMIDALFGKGHCEAQARAEGLIRG